MKFDSKNNLLDINNPNSIYYHDNPNNKSIQCDLGNGNYKFY